MKQSSTIEIPDEFNELWGFLQEIFKKDQSDPQRSNAPTCYEMLLARQKEFIGTPLEDSFFNALSFESFHIAQTAARTGNNTEAAKYLTISLDAALKGPSREWEAYVKGTKCYFENDLDGLRREIPNSGIKNGLILQNLLKGHLDRGSTNYTKDYFGIG